MSIVWPVIIKYSGEDELLFVKDELTWLADTDLCAYVYDASDVLVDANGALYTLRYEVETRQTLIEAQQKIVSINQFEAWVKSYLALLNQCCSSKLTLASIADGVALIEQLAQQSEL
jgi:hypothetical protein